MDWFEIRLKNDEIFLSLRHSLYICKPTIDIASFCQGHKCSKISVLRYVLKVPNGLHGAITTQYHLATMKAIMEMCMFYV